MSREPILAVAVPAPLMGLFDYLAPLAAEPAPQPGVRVRVPFGRGSRVGLIVGVKATSDLPAERLRRATAVLDPAPLLPADVRRLLDWAAAYYQHPPGEVMAAALPTALRDGQDAGGTEHVFQLTPAGQSADEATLRRAPVQYRVLAQLRAAAGQLTADELAASGDGWRRAVHGLKARGLVAEARRVPALPAVAATRDTPPELSPHQATAVAAVNAAAGYRCFLLDGVTGSGKTEVYLRILEAVQQLGRSAIVLVPEISLTPQTVGRFASRFPDVAVLHSGLTDAERGRQWQRLLQGHAKVAVGARSALFAPVQNLGMIVVDEEHEASFKQDSTPRYHAREMAIVRGEIENAVVVLGSATPTLESIGKARRGIYELLTLPQRAGAGRLPKIVVQDLRSEPKETRRAGVVLSRTLLVMMQERLAARDQVLLFLNRRGYSPVLLCPGCGEAVKCEACSVSMTWHVRRGRLVCHWCCNEKRRPEVCPTCQHAGMHELGVGTERLEHAVKSHFPEAIVARMDADTMAERGAHERVLGAFRKRHIDVLIGTQMIAKGLDFPDVTLVGVVSADTGLFVPDYRAAERTFQLLHQVAGRAGRGEKAGTVVIQTYCPDNYAVQAAANNDYSSFVQQELTFRKLTGYPPFSRLLRVLAEARREDEARTLLQQAVEPLRGIADVEVLGPSPAVIARVKDQWRWHMLVKCYQPAAFAAAMAAVGTVEDRGTRTCRVTLDVDPASLM